MSIKILVALLPVIAVICACGDRGDDLREPSESEKAEIRGKITALDRQVGFDVVIPPSFPSDLNPVPATDHVPRRGTTVHFSSLVAGGTPTHPTGRQLTPLDLLKN